MNGHGEKMDIAAQNVMIVGGTSGIGLAVASEVAERGGNPIVLSRREESVTRALNSLPAGARGGTLDLTDPRSVASLATDYGPIDHLVYTAGEALELVRVADMTPEVVRGFFETRLIGAISVVRAVAPVLHAGSSITLTSGSAARRPGAGWGLGASICGAMNSLTLALAVELAPVRVNAVSPGVVRSPLWANLSDDDRDGMYESGSQLPVGRVGEVDDVALAYVYAMEQEYGTGAIISVDGGTALV
jgi:NAD(P)-dependent dehydrogenase (short-subunit alcohol dehydrogenase family)